VVNYKTTSTTSTRQLFQRTLNCPIMSWRFKSQYEKCQWHGTGRTLRLRWLRRYSFICIT